MDNSNENSVSIENDSATQPLQVIKVYPLDGKPVADSQFWVAVTQFPNESAKRLFLRDGHHHRLISMASALKLLSSENKKDLFAIFKVTSNKGGSSPVISPNTIEHIHNHPIFNQVNVTESQNASNKQLIGVDVTHVSNQESVLGQKNSTFSATSTNLIAIAELVQKAQLESWGAIKVTGSDFFCKQVWQEAAARGLYVEGYLHTEDDRQALLKLIPQHLHSRIRPEYRPIKIAKKLFSKKASRIKANSSNIKKQEITANDYQNKLNILDLSAQELSYLLMRVHQMELNKQNLTNPEIELISNDGFVHDKAHVESLPIQNIITNESNVIPRMIDQLSEEFDI